MGGRFIFRTCVQLYADRPLRGWAGSSLITLEDPARLVDPFPSSAHPETRRGHWRPARVSALKGRYSAAEDHLPTQIARIVKTQRSALDKLSA